MDKRIGGVLYNDVMQQHRDVDKIFLAIVIVLIGLGFLIFVSASLGIWAQNEVKFSNGL